MECFDDLPLYLQDRLSISCLLSPELSSSLLPTIQHELGETVIDILNKLPTKEWMIAGGFMAFVAGHTKYYGDIDIFLYKFVSIEELGDDWQIHSTLGNSWNYNFHSEESWYLNFQRIASGKDKYIVYDHKNTKVQLIVPFYNESISFLNYCSDMLMKFDIEYCKLGWIGTTKVVMDLRGIRSKNIHLETDHWRSRYRQRKYEDRLVNKKLPVPRLSTLSYVKSRGIFVVYTLGCLGTGMVRRGVCWGVDY